MCLGSLRGRFVLCNNGQVRRSPYTAVVTFNLFLALQTKLSNIDTRFTVILEDDTICHEVPHGFLEYAESQHHFAVNDVVEALGVPQHLYSVGKVLACRREEGQAFYSLRLQRIADDDADEPKRDDSEFETVEVDGDHLRKYFAPGWHVSIFSPVRNQWAVCIILQRHEDATSSRGFDYHYDCM